MSPIINTPEDILSVIGTGFCDPILQQLSDAAHVRKIAIRKQISNDMVSSFKTSGIKYGDIIQLAFSANNNDPKPRGFYIQYHCAGPKQWDGTSVVFLGRTKSNLKVSYPSDFEHLTKNKISLLFNDKKMCPHSKFRGRSGVPIYFFKGFEQFRILEKL